MNNDFEVVNVQEKALECKKHVHPYFIMDILSGDCLGIFTVENVQTAIRSFCMSMDNMPQGIVHDSILADYETGEVIFEGRDYLETWQEHQKPVVQMPHFNKEDKTKGQNK